MDWWIFCLANNGKGHLVFKSIVVTDFSNDVKGQAFSRIEIVTTALFKLFFVKRMGDS